MFDLNGVTPHLVKKMRKAMPAIVEAMAMPKFWTICAGEPAVEN